MVHPYFAPDCYASGELRVEWWHWLSRDYFVHSNQCWYSLQYGIATDSNLITYHDLRAIFNYDVNSCLSVGADVRRLSGWGHLHAVPGDGVPASTVPGQVRPAPRMRRRRMDWWLLLLAGLLEVGWAVGLKYSEGFTRLWPTVFTGARRWRRA